MQVHHGAIFIGMEDVIFRVLVHKHGMNRLIHPKKIIPC